MSTSKLKVLVIAAVWLLVASTAATAREWAIVGPRALAMGGAGVAVVDDPSAVYWNPAAFGFFARTPPGEEKKNVYEKRNAGAGGAIGLGTQVHEDLGTFVDRVMAFDFNAFSGGTIAAESVPDYLRLVDELAAFNENPDRALTVKVDGGAFLQASHYGAGALFLSEISARGDLDLVNVGVVNTGVTFTINDITDPANYGCSAPCTGGTFLSASDKTGLDTFLAGLGWTAAQRTDFINAIDYGLTQADATGVAIPGDIVPIIEDVATLADTAATSGGSLAENTSRLLFKGVALAEVPVTFGRAITDGLAVGANVKYMRARVYNTSVDVFNTDFSTALADATSDYMDSSNIGMDVGMLYNFKDFIRFGVVGRNVNEPEFDMKRLLPGDDDHIAEKAQVRAGVAITPLGFITFALDCDVTENDTTVSNGFKSRNLGGGVEVELGGFLKLRGGAYKNLSADDVGIVYTAGAGISLLAFNLDAGASLSQDATTIDGNTIPEEFKAELAMSLLF